MLVACLMAPFEIQVLMYARYAVDGRTTHKSRYLFKERWGEKEM